MKYNKSLASLLRSFAKSSYGGRVGIRWVHHLTKAEYPTFCKYDKLGWFPVVGDHIHLSRQALVYAHTCWIRIVREEGEEWAPLYATYDLDYTETALVVEDTAMWQSLREWCIDNDIGMKIMKVSTKNLWPNKPYDLVAIENDPVKLMKFRLVWGG